MSGGFLTQLWKGCPAEFSESFIFHAHMGHRSYENMNELKKTFLSADWSICDDYLCEKIDSGGRLSGTFSLLPRIYFSTSKSYFGIFDPVQVSWRIFQDKTKGI